MIQLILNAKFHPYMWKNFFRYRCTWVGGAKSDNVLINIKDTKYFVLYTSILICHKESFVSMILRNEWYVAPSGYSYNTHMFVFERHPLVRMAHLTNTCMSLMRTMRHFTPFEVSFKTISDHSDWNFRGAPNIPFISTSNDFQIVFANVLLWYLIVLRRISTSTVLKCIMK